MLTVVLGAFLAGLAAAGAIQSIMKLRRGPGGVRRYTAWRRLPLQVSCVIVGVLLALAGYRPGLAFSLLAVGAVLTVAEVGWFIWLRMSHS